MYVKLGHEIREVTNERGVYKYLMDGYRLSVRPVRNDSDTVDVKVDLYLNILEDLVRSTVALLPHIILPVIVVIAAHFMNYDQCNLRIDGNKGRHMHPEYLAKLKVAFRLSSF